MAAPTGAQSNPVLSGAGKGDADRTISIDSGKLTARLVQTAPPGKFLLEPTYQIVAQLPDGSERACRETFCFTHSAALRSVSWNARERELVIAHEADYSTWTALYGWKPESGPRGSFALPTAHSMADRPTATGLARHKAPICFASMQAPRPRPALSISIRRQARPSPCSIPILPCGNASSIPHALSPGAARAGTILPAFL
jgi:hypothetical protein